MRKWRKKEAAKQVKRGKKWGIMRKWRKKEAAKEALSEDCAKKGRKKGQKKRRKKRRHQQIARKKCGKIINVIHHSLSNILLISR